MAVTLVQLTDPHLGAAWIEDPDRALADAVAAVRRLLPTAPDAVIVSGDIADTGTDADYAEARALLDRLGAPVLALPGNHDDRDGLRRHFEFPRTEGEYLNYVVDFGAIRLIALDTKRREGDGGQLDQDRLEWLDGALGEDTSTPTLLVMHHPPFVTGIRGMDAIGIPEEERHALEEIIARHRQLQLIAAGHVHRAIVGALGHATVLAVPSTAAQLALEFDTDQMRFVHEPASFAVHLAVDGQIVSHLQPIRAAGQ